MPFEIVRRRITDMQTDAIVSPALPVPIINTGVEREIYHHAGANLGAARRAIGAITAGSAEISNGFGLQAKYIIHAVSPFWHGGSRSETALLSACYQRIFSLAVMYRCESVAFPLLGTEQPDFPRSLAMQTAMQEIRSFLQQNEMHVYLVLDHDEQPAFTTELAASVTTYIDQLFPHTGPTIPRPAWAIYDPDGDMATAPPLPWQESLAESFTVSEPQEDETIFAPPTPPPSLALQQYMQNYMMRGSRSTAPVSASDDMTVPAEPVSASDTMTVPADEFPNDQDTLELPKVVAPPHYDRPAKLPPHGIPVTDDQTPADDDIGFDKPIACGAPRPDLDHERGIITLPGNTFDDDDSCTQPCIAGSGWDMEKLMRESFGAAAPVPPPPPSFSMPVPPPVAPSPAAASSIPAPPITYPEELPQAAASAPLAPPPISFPAELPPVAAASPLAPPPISFPEELPATPPVPAPAQGKEPKPEKKSKKSSSLLGKLRKKKTTADSRHELNINPPIVLTPPQTPQRPQEFAQQQPMMQYQQQTFQSTVAAPSPAFTAPSPAITAPSPVRPAPFASDESLTKRIRELDASFSTKLMQLIDRTGQKDSEIYKKANVDRKLFSKIRSNPDYKPSKSTVIAFSFALELDIDETRDLLSRAGFALSHSSKSDVIVEFFIQRRNYDVFQLNEILFHYDQPLIGA